MLHQHDANPQENNAEERRQQSCFATLLKLYPRTDMPLKVYSTSAENPPPKEYLWATASACQKNFKRLKL